jgi:hypothetical protein
LTSSSTRRQPRAGALERRDHKRAPEPRAAGALVDEQVLEQAVAAGPPDPVPEPQLRDPGRLVAIVRRGEQELGVRVGEEALDAASDLGVRRRGEAEMVAEPGHQAGHRREILRLRNADAGHDRSLDGRFDDPRGRLPHDQRRVGFADGRRCPGA